jgi:hypothetical protein
MKDGKVVVLTLAEAKFILAEFYVDVLLNDRGLTREIVTSGKLETAVPNFATLTPAKVAEFFGEFNLGSSIAEAKLASHVVVEIAPEKWELVFDIGNVQPKHRWGEWKVADPAS